MCKARIHDGDDWGVCLFVCLFVVLYPFESVSRSHGDGGGLKWGCATSHSSERKEWG